MKNMLCLVVLFAVQSGADATPGQPAWVSDIYCQYDVSTSKENRTTLGSEFSSSFKPHAVYSGGSGAPWGIPDGAFKNGDELNLKLSGKDFAETIGLSFRHLDAGDKLLEVYLDFYPNEALAKSTNAVHYRGRLAIDSDETQKIELTHNLTDNGSKAGAIVGSEEVTDVSVSCGYQKGWSQRNNESCKEFELGDTSGAKDKVDPLNYFQCTTVNKATPRTKHMPIFTSDTDATGSTEAAAVRALKARLCSAGIEFKDKQFYCLKKVVAK